MAQYIDKDALVAEIENLENRYEKCPTRNSYEDGLKEGRLIGYKDALHKINNLEVKEVDLDFTKEVDMWISNNGDTNGFFNVQELAKHFFELGLKAQQNINIGITNIDKVMEENGVDPNSKEAKVFKESYYIALEKLKHKKENKL